MSKKQVTSPRGKLMWVFISGEGRLNDLNQKKEFSAEVHMPLADGKPLIAEIDAFLAENKDKSMKGNPKSTGYRIDEASNTVRFIFKTGAAFPDGTTKKIKTYDSQAKLVTLEPEVRVGNGSIGRISGTLALYNAPGAWGASLYLDAVQIVRLEKFADSSSFSAENDEGGFVGASTPFAAEDAI